NFLAIHKVCLRKFASSGGKIYRPFGIFGCEYRFLDWACLGWNKPSIDFYLSLDTTLMDQWTVHRGYPAQDGRWLNAVESILL
ncbi:MAG: hypothetical protein J1F18_15940, partial [Lachnospiraceae bacterium]|nr:hypothetical protein [Lachnospiraceae bacterium]